MRLLFVPIGLLLALTSVVSARAQDLTVEEVIQRQIAAFQADDVDAAFAFASPNIQRLLGTPERFGAMVRQGYPMVWRPSEVDFVDQVSDGATVFQRLRIRDRMGRDYWFGYQMIEVDGNWRIDGVYPIGALGDGV